MPRNTKNRKQHSDETKELARARVASGESLSKVARELGVAKSTLSSWLTQADRDGHQQTREQRKEQFIHKAWDAIEKYLEHLVKDEVIKAAAAHNATTVIGTLYDKIALASGDVTTRGEVKGQVTQRYEYDITHRIEQYADVYRQLARRSVLCGGDASNNTGEPMDTA